MEREDCFDELMMQAVVEEDGAYVQVRRFKDSGRQGAYVTRNEDKRRLYIWPHGGGVIILNRDGTWDGDIAPFAD